MVCITVTVSSVTLTVTASNVGFNVSTCSFNIAAAVNPMEIQCDVTASAKLKADVTLSWKIDGVLKSQIITQLTFNAGTVNWALNSSYNWIVGVYTEPKVTFSNIVAV